MSWFMITAITMPITYPRPCPKSGKKYKNRFDFCRHKKYCGTNLEVACLHCDKLFSRKDKMTAYVKKFHSETAKRKAEEGAELLRLELLNSGKVPRLGNEEQTGGAVTTRGMTHETDEGDHKSGVKVTKGKKRGADQGDNKSDIKVSKEEVADKSEDSTDTYGGGPDPLYVAEFKKLGPAKRWKKNTVVNQKFILTLDQKRGLKENEDLNIGATHAIAVGIDKLVEDLKIPDNYWMTLQIGSREHRKEGLTGESWGVRVGDFTGRAAYAQALLQKLSNVLNSAQFITNDIGFSASVLFTRPEMKGGKRAGGGPGQKIWSHLVKESRCVCEIKNKDSLCCARAIVVMREYAKRQAGEHNTFENIHQDRGKNSQQLKEAKRLHDEAGVAEGLCGLEEIDKFQDYLGPQGYRIIVVDACRGGVIFKGDAFKEAGKIIAIVKSVYEDEKGDLKAHYDGLYSIPGFMNRSYFCYRCCKGYNTENSAHHNCEARNCPGCLRRKTDDHEGCTDFTFGVNPDRSCIICRREFYGEVCFQNHLIKEAYKDPSLKRMTQLIEDELDEDLSDRVKMISVCDQYRKCKDCGVTYKVKEDTSHKCLRAMCKHCFEYVNIYEHKCFITSEEEKCFKRTLKEFQKQKREKEKLYTELYVEEDAKDEFKQKVIDDLMKQRKRKVDELNAINNGIPMEEIMRRREQQRLDDLCERAIQQLQERGVALEAITQDMVDREVRRNQKQEEDLTSQQEPSTIMIFADVECLLDSSNTFVPILICYARHDDDTIYHHWGTNCIQTFIETMIYWSNQDKKEEDTKELHIFFHNLKGFDGCFMIDALYKMNLKVTEIMATGTKALHFKHRNLVFKDSLSFLNMPLTNFTKTFGLTELKKGWFPHKFSKLEYLEYEGTIPDLSYYNTKHMKVDKKKECETWHANEVLKGEVWNFRNELLSYCKSDVQLMKEGCLKFAEDTTRDAGFNPL